ncbi:MAG: APC family permease [Lachnospiraceae bacterium]|nr:APC family permease [Lachnospiraceae bacterium]
MENENGKLNVLACVAIIVSSMIGSAIFSLSGLTIGMAGPSAILSWAIAAIIMLFYGLFMCELATIFPKSGGAFYFPYKALGKNEKEGKFFGYISALAYIVSNITAISFSAIYVGTYLSASFPIFADKQVMMAIVTILLAYVYNTLDIKKASNISFILVVMLAVTLFVFIISCMTSGSFDLSINDTFFSDGSIKKYGFLSAVPTAMVGYGSIVAMCFMVSEVKDKKKTLPLAAVISILIVALLYCFSIFAVVGMITSKELIDTNMTYVPFFAVCFIKLSHIPYLAKIVSVSAVIALVSTVFVIVSLTARALQMTSSKDINIFPEILSKKNKRGVPAIASLVVCIVACALACFPDLTSEIVSLGALLNVIGIFTHMISLYVVRKKIQDKDKRMLSMTGSDIYKVGGGNVLIIIIMMIILLCYIPDIISGGYKMWIFTICLYVIGFIYYKLYTSRK